jgi:hypothetical protein
MAITPSGSVRIDKPEDVSGDEMVQRIFNWFDANQIEPELFQAELQTNGIDAFEITFASAEHAALFNSQFG